MPILLKTEYTKSVFYSLGLLDRPNFCLRFTQRALDKNCHYKLFKYLNISLDFLLVENVVELAKKKKYIT